MKFRRSVPVWSNEITAPIDVLLPDVEPYVGGNPAVVDEQSCGTPTAASDVNNFSIFGGILSHQLGPRIRGRKEFFHRDRSHAIEQAHRWNGNHACPTRIQGMEPRAVGEGDAGYCGIDHSSCCAANQCLWMLLDPSFLARLYAIHALQAPLPARQLASRLRRSQR